MSEYTPTKDAVRCFYVAARKKDDDEAALEFDRWLEAHDREVAAEAWDEGVEAEATRRYPGRSEKPLHKAGYFGFIAGARYAANIREAHQS